MGAIGGMVWAVLVICGAAAGLAAVLNLPISAAAKFLIVLGTGVIWLGLFVFAEIDKRLSRLEYWTRLLFISTELRNEADGLPAASERLESDLEREKSSDRIMWTLGGGIGTRLVSYFFAAVLFLGAFLLVLRAGWFGDLSIESLLNGMGLK